MKERECRMSNLDKSKKTNMDGEKRNEKKNVQSKPKTIKSASIVKSEKVRTDGKKTSAARTDIKAESVTAEKQIYNENWYYVKDLCLEAGYKSEKLLRRKLRKLVTDGIIERPDARLWYWTNKKDYMKVLAIVKK